MTEEKQEIQIPCPQKCKSPKCKANIRKKHIDFTKKPIVWILGGPGSGKGTQCEKIVAKYGFLHLSTGDLLRAEVKSGSIRAVYLTDIMGHGGLVPNDVVLELLKEHMEDNFEKAKGFLIDGYPREWRQGPEFEKLIASPTVIIYLDTSHETMTQRLKERAETSDRADDNDEETIKVRLKTHAENTDAILKHYEDKDKLRTINAEQTAEEVFLEVQEVLDPLIPHIVRTASITTVKSTKSVKSTKPGQS